MTAHPSRVCLFESDTRGLEPLTATKPVWELRTGASTFLERVERVFPGVEILLAGRRSLAALNEARVGIPMAEEVPRAGTLFLDAGIALAASDAATLTSFGESPCRVHVGGIFAGAYLGDGLPVAVETDIAARLDEASARTLVRPLDAPLVRSLPDFIVHMERLVVTDASLIEPSRTLGEGTSDGVTVLGPHPVRVGERVRIDPGSTLDARNGPISLAEDVVVSFNTWLVGPASIGAGTRLLGGTIGPIVGIGPVCRVRGEVAESFVHGFSNKAHDGFIGHSVLGEWVNLGAMTTCSDLKNTYSGIRLPIDGREVETGLDKLGVFIGDHAKTAIGTLLTTGSVIGVGANVFGFPSLCPKMVPDFAWGDGARGSTALDRFLNVAERVMQRRGVPLDAATRARLVHLHAADRGV